jgi:hypothetical protein
MAANVGHCEAGGANWHRRQLFTLLDPIHTCSIVASRCLERRRNHQLAANGICRSKLCGLRQKEAGAERIITHQVIIFSEIQNVELHSKNILKFDVHKHQVLLLQHANTLTVFKFYLVTYQFTCRLKHHLSGMMRYIQIYCLDSLYHLALN